MKKGATKVLVAVLCLSMVLGTSMSAMAAITVDNTDVKVDFVTGATTVTTSVTTDANEKVTYMVHDAADFYSVTKDNVKYIDQKTINTTTDTFQYTTNAFGASDVVYVGGDSLNAPTTSTTTTSKSGLTINIDGLEASNNWEANDSYVKITMANAADVTAVTLGADATETNFAVGNGVLYVMLPASATQWTEELAIVNITTDAGTSTTATSIKLGKVTLTDTALTAYAKVTGTNFGACGIKVAKAGGTFEPYEAYGVKGDGNYAGAFAVELVADSGLLNEFAGATVKAYVDSNESEEKNLD